MGKGDVSRDRCRADGHVIGHLINPFTGNAEG